MSADDTDVTAKVVNLNDYKQNKLDEEFEKEYYIEFTPDFEVDEVSFNLEDFDIKLDFVEDTFNQFLEVENQKEAMMHIANLLELVDYNVDWNQAPDWHRNLRDNALSFYYQFYGKQ